MVNLCYEPRELKRGFRVSRRLEQLLAPPALTAEETGDGCAIIKINDVMPMHVARAIAALLAQHGEFTEGEHQMDCDSDRRSTPSCSAG